VLSSKTWPFQLGHALSSRLKSLFSICHLGSIDNNNFDCPPCQLGKHHALPFNFSEFVSHAPFDFIHYDIWGPSPTPTMGGSRYFLIFVDNHSCYE